jgi:transposase
MDRYIGLDAHASSCTLAVIDSRGKRLGSSVVATTAPTLIEAVRAIRGRRHLALEEGTLAGWLYEVLTPEVNDLVVAAVPESRGPKSDERDAFHLADELRTGGIKRTVYKARGGYAALGYQAKVYARLVSDSVRVMLRLKSLFRSRGVFVRGDTGYSLGGRRAWIAQLPPAARPAVALCYAELDALLAVRAQAATARLAEARHHPVWRLVRTCPGLGPIRSALLIPIVVTPARFRSKRAFWSYCGLGLVTRSSADWVRTASGHWVRARVPLTRGLNPTCHRTLKYLFKSAAVTVIRRAADEPLYRHYQALLAGGTKPHLAALTIARQLATIVLALWRTGARYDPRQLERRIAMRPA